MLTPSNKVWELTFQGLNVYEGNYSAYKIQKKNELKTITRECSKIGGIGYFKGCARLVFSELSPFRTCAPTRINGSRCVTDWGTRALQCWN